MDDREWCSIYGYEIPRAHACVIGVCFNPYRDGQELVGTVTERFARVAQLQAEMRS